MMQEIDLSADIPTYTLSFGSLPSILVIHDLPSIPHCPSESFPTIVDNNNMAVVPTVSLLRTKQLKQNTESTTLKTSCSSPALPSLGSHDFIWKSPKIDIFAIDRVNVFYTSYSEDNSNLIAYCHFHDRSDTALSCIWNQSRILDIAWWDCVSAFVCVTNDGIYNVTIENGAFKIETKVKAAWSHVRISINSRCLWLWTKSDTFHGVLVYGSDFKIHRTIDVTNSQIKHFVRDSSSFCLTDTLVASVYIQTDRNRHRLQVHLNDFNLINFKTVRLGPFNGDIIIRTDGNNQFYILAGRKTMHVISSTGNKAFFDLNNDYDTFAVVDSQCVLLNREHRTLKVLTL
jgi:hypothetical protein